jgi:hypothetical protein
VAVGLATTAAATETVVLVHDAVSSAVAAKQAVMPRALTGVLGARLVRGSLKRESPNFSWCDGWD